MSSTLNDSFITTVISTVIPANKAREQQINALVHNEIKKHIDHKNININIIMDTVSKIIEKVNVYSYMGENELAFNIEDDNTLVNVSSIEKPEFKYADLIAYIIESIGKYAIDRRPVDNMMSLNIKW